MEKIKCVWKIIDEENAINETSCGHLFSFVDDGVKENGFIYCPYCGREIEEKVEDNGL